MNQVVLRQLAEERLLDAESLIAAGRWSGAYYLAGYAIECALKASIAGYTSACDFPDQNFAKSCYTHDLNSLMKIADLKNQFDFDAVLNPLLKNNWGITKDWNEVSRYRIWAQHQAENLFNAVADPNNGVMSWLRPHY